MDNSDEHYKYIIKNMTPQQKLDTAMSLYWSARELKKAFLRKKYSDKSEQEIEDEVKRIFMYESS